VSGQGKWKVPRGLDSTEVLALFFEISMHGASSALFNAAFITAAMLQKLLIFHRPFEWFPRLVSMFHILWMAATIGGSEIAFVSKAATLFSGFYSKFFSCFLAI